jgi:hypothetical protein
MLPVEYSCCPQAARTNTQTMLNAKIRFFNFFSSLNQSQVFPYNSYRDFNWNINRNYKIKLKISNNMELFSLKNCFWFRDW